MADDPATAQPVPNIRMPDIQVLVQDFAQSRRDLFEERKNSQNRIAEERERSRWETERLRKEFGAQIRNLESENEALVRTVGRIQTENDRLREENAILRHTKNGVPAAQEKPAQAEVQPTKGPDVATMLSAPPKHIEVPIVMTQSPVAPMPSFPLPTRVPAGPAGGTPVFMPPGSPLPPAPPPQR